MILLDSKERLHNVCYWKEMNWDLLCLSLNSSKRLHYVVENLGKIMSLTESGNFYVVYDCVILLEDACVALTIKRKWDIGIGSWGWFGLVVFLFSSMEKDIFSTSCCVM